MEVEERRAHPRIPIGFGALVHYGDTKVAAATRDMSLGGCLLESETQIPEATEVGIALYVTIDGIDADLPPLKVMGTTRWSAEGESDGDVVYFSGVQFQGLNEPQTKWLADVLRRYGQD